MGVPVFTREMWAHWTSHIQNGDLKLLTRYKGNSIHISLFSELFENSSYVVINKKANIQTQGVP